MIRILENNHLDFSHYIPNDTILNKIQDYKDRNSKVNVKAIKSDDKLIKYYIAGIMLDFTDLCDRIVDRADTDNEDVVVNGEIYSLSYVINEINRQFSNNSNFDTIDVVDNSEENIIDTIDDIWNPINLKQVAKSCKAKFIDNNGSYEFEFNDNGYTFIDGVLSHKYSGWEKEINTLDELYDCLSKQRGDYEYRCGFGLTIFVLPGKGEQASREYLGEDNMAQYLDGELSDIVYDMRWTQYDKQSGDIVIDTNQRLKKVHLDALSREIEGQNWDGLGEGWEQQWFVKGRKPSGEPPISAGRIYKYMGFKSTT